MGDMLNVFDDITGFIKGFSEGLESTFVNGVRNKYHIKKIIVNDPCCILITKGGNKWVVKAVEGDKFSLKIGILLVLYKYLFEPDRYSEMLSILEDVELRSTSLLFLSGAILPIIGKEAMQGIFRKSSEKSYTINVEDIFEECSHR